MHKLVFPPIRHEAAKSIDHVRACAAWDPNVAVDDPDYISLRGPVAGAHVTDFGVRAQIMLALAIEVWVFVFDEDLGVEGGEVIDEGLED